jgi:arginine exporter protein ArgO
MILNGKIDDDDKPTDGTPTRAWAITLGICAIPVYIAFSAFGMDGKGTVAMIALITLIGAVRLHLEFKRRVWFWIVIALAAIANALIVICVPFPNKNYIFPVVAPLGFADYLLISLCIRSVERVMMKKRLPDTSQG